MKRILLITAVLSITLTACKKKDEAVQMNVQSTSQELNCAENETMKELNAIVAVPEVLDWLKQNGDRICSENLYICIEERHLVSQEDFERFASDHPENNPAEKSYTLSWGDISMFIKNNQMDCYQKYVGFTFNKDEVSLKSLSFTDQESCYSVPMLRGISERHNLTDNDSLTFIKGMVPDPANPGGKHEKVLIKYVGPTSTTFYDLSDDPR